MPPALIKEEDHIYDDPPALSDTKQDYIDHYEDIPNSSDNNQPTEENTYNTEIESKEEGSIASLGSMADQVVNRVEEMKSEEVNNVNVY